VSDESMKQPRCVCLVGVRPAAECAQAVRVRVWI